MSYTNYCNNFSNEPYQHWSEYVNPFNYRLESTCRSTCDREKEILNKQIADLNFQIRGLPKITCPPNLSPEVIRLRSEIENYKKLKNL